MTKASDGLIVEELRRLARLLALLATRDMMQADQVDYLKRAGFGLKESANLIGTTVKTVEVTRAKNKKRRGRRGKKVKGGTKGGRGGKRTGVA